MKRTLPLILLTLLIGSFVLIPLDVHIPHYKGVCFVGSRSVDEKDFIRLSERNVNWISQTPFGFQRDYNKPNLRMKSGNYYLWGESEEGIAETTQLARKYGIKTILKPHIWMRSRGTDKWRSDIKMDTEEDWKTWFSQYREFIIRYAKLADSINIEALSIGTELHTTIKDKPDEWRKLIKEIRTIYKGQLTYSANWYQEYLDVSFWDELDFIGIQGYFPLSDVEHPDLESLKKGWEKHIPEIRSLYEKYDKPIVFTEIGYKSSPKTAIAPWEWREEVTESQEKMSLETQALCYEAFFQTFWNEPWFEGVFFWKWFPDYRFESGRRIDRFSPQYKPAEDVMKTWFGH